MRVVYKSSENNVIIIKIYYRNIVFLPTQMYIYIYSMIDIDER